MYHERPNKPSGNRLARWFRPRTCAVCNRSHFFPHRQCMDRLSNIVVGVRSTIEKGHGWENSKWQELFDQSSGPVTHCINDCLKREVVLAILGAYYESGNYGRFTSNENAWFELLSKIGSLTPSDLEWQLYHRMCLITELQTEEFHTKLTDRLEQMNCKFGNFLQIWMYSNQQKFNIKTTAQLWRTIWSVSLSLGTLASLTGTNLQELLSELELSERLPHLVFIALLGVIAFQVDVGFSWLVISPAGVLYSSRYADNEIPWIKILNVKASNFLWLSWITVRLEGGFIFTHYISKFDQRWLELVVKLHTAKAHRLREQLIVEQFAGSH